MRLKLVRLLIWQGSNAKELPALAHPVALMSSPHKVLRPPRSSLTTTAVGVAVEAAA